MISRYRILFGGAVPAHRELATILGGVVGMAEWLNRKNKGQRRYGVPHSPKKASYLAQSGGRGGMVRSLCGCHSVAEDSSMTEYRTHNKLTQGTVCTQPSSSMS